MRATASAGRSQTPGAALEAGRVVARAARSGLSGEPGAAFLARRAVWSSAMLEAEAARRPLERAARALLDSPVDRCSLSRALVCWGGLLERRQQNQEAVEAYEAALLAEPESPAVMLHAARAHRKAGNRAAALRLYRRVREDGDARLALFSKLGEALLATSPESALAEVLESAASAGDGEVQAVALEERAALRRRSNPEAALSDLMAAGLRYDDRRDRLRVAHSLADLLLARGDVEAAAEALGAALELTGEAERGHVVQRLRSLARMRGDELGLRRWPPAGGSPLVSLMPTGGRAVEVSVAPEIQRWRGALRDA